MDKILEKYLDTVDRHLRPLPASERVDIVKEIKGSMMEMQSEGISAEKIAQKLEIPGNWLRPIWETCLLTVQVLAGRDF
ncbi:MAG: HAAS signaling domain-containing protein [Anaerovoracaceae bacterium]